MIKSTRLAAVLFLFLALTTPSYGYIDPGTGSYVIQILIGAFVAVSLGIRIFWRRILDFFGKIFSKKNDSPKE